MVPNRHSGNTALDYSRLSLDRWRLYGINNRNELVNVTDKYIQPLIAQGWMLPMRKKICKNLIDLTNFKLINTPAVGTSVPLINVPAVTFVTEMGVASAMLATTSTAAPSGRIRSEKGGVGNPVRDPSSDEHHRL